MAAKKHYNGLDAVKFFLAVLVAQRHVVQIFFGADSRWRILINNWMSNLAVPVFFIIAGFFLFGKILAGQEQGQGTGGSIIRRYCGRILKMYVLWSVIYLPIDWYNWYHGPRAVKGGILGWLHAFLVCNTIPQLWYLPALALACFLVWLAWKNGIRTWQILCVGAVLLLAGYLGDNWYYNQRFPETIQKLLELYRRWFVTPRNGIFYGIFYVALGLHFAEAKRQLPAWGGWMGFLFFFWCMYREVMKISDAGSNTNFVITAAPAAYCLFAAASQVRWKDRKLYERLRGMSEWIYLAHFYFFYFLVWLRPWNPVPFNSKSVTVMIMAPLLIFAWCLVRLSETGGGRWLKKLI